MAHRPRIHELGYSPARMLLTLDVAEGPEGFAWEILPCLLAAYQTAAGTRLTALELEALAPYTASVALFQAAMCGFLPNPADALLDDERRQLMRIREWLLAHPESVTNEKCGAAVAVVCAGGGMSDISWGKVIGKIAGIIATVVFVYVHAIVAYGTWIGVTWHGWDALPPLAIDE